MQDDPARTWRRLSSILLLAALGASWALAQLPTGTILGTLRDSTGALIPGAAVTAQNLETGLTRTTTSGANGSYRLAALPAGTYEVRVERHGFQTAVRGNVELTVGQEIVVNFSFEMLAAPSDSGPFAPVVGYAGAIMAAGAALYFLWGGRMEKWRPPDEDLPGMAQAFVLLLCGVGMVGQWYFAVPETITWILSAVGALAVASVVCFLRYSSLLGIHTYIKKVATSRKSTRDLRILGGRELLPEAEKKRQELGVDVQTLYEGAGYNADLLWSRHARQWVKQRVLLFFILTLVLGTSALTGASFATQVLLTKKAAASVIHTTEAPALPSSRTDPSDRTEGIYLPEEQARAQISSALHDGQIDLAMTILKSLAPGLARTEECERVFSFCIKNLRLDDATIVATGCWEGKRRQEALEQIALAGLKER